jgi:hypothetical protein
MKIKAAQKVFPLSDISLPSLSPFTSLRTQPKKLQKIETHPPSMVQEPGDAQKVFSSIFHSVEENPQPNLCFGSHTKHAGASLMGDSHL